MLIGKTCVLKPVCNEILSWIEKLHSQWEKAFFSQKVIQALDIELGLFGFCTDPKEICIHKF